MFLLNRPLLLLFILLPLFWAAPAAAAVEVGRMGAPAATIADVYLRDGTAFLSLEEVLNALDLKGSWDPVKHIYRFSTPSGSAVISPGSVYLRVGERFISLDAPPRFIDGRLRVSEGFVVRRIPELLREPIYYRNLQPRAAAAQETESPLDRLFAFLLRKSRPAPAGPVLRGIVLDPGHGGDDPGAVSAGATEKGVVMDLARRLEKLVKMRLGIPVHLTRNGDYTVTSQQRLQSAARPDTDALLLLHAQGALSPRPRGITLFVRPQEEPAEGGIVIGEGGSMRLAAHLMEALRKEGFAVTGILRAPLPPLGRGDLPAVLVELGFLTNPDDLRLLTDPAGQERLAEALYAGLTAFAEQERKEMTP